MFHKASIKLAAFYLGILMVISVFFSATLYQAYMTELNRSFERQGTILDTPYGANIPRALREQIRHARTVQYDEAQSRVVARLVLLNVIILTGGGLLSYYLALRTLRPIEEAHEAQSQFTADASHELRTPITVMRSENEVALMNPKLTLSNAKQQLRSNIEELDKLTALADGLLQLSRLENRDIPKTPVQPEVIVMAAIDHVLPRAEERHIIITPKIVSTPAVLIDQTSMTEALVTLLDNAIKYSPVKSEIIIQVAKAQKDISIAVIDDGPGIAAGEIRHVFDRFYRADYSRSKRDIQGYGLGLAIAKSIVERHHGHIDVRSTLGKGSTFTITLPAAD